MERLGYSARALLLRWGNIIADKHEVRSNYGSRGRIIARVTQDLTRIL